MGQHFWCHDMHRRLKLFGNARQYLMEVRGEFHKITWPVRKEYVGGTIAVLIIVAIVATVLGLIDVGLGQLMKLVVPS